MFLVSTFRRYSIQNPKLLQKNSYQHFVLDQDFYGFLWKQYFGTDLIVLE